MPVSLLSAVWDGNPSENGRSPRVWQVRQGHQLNVHRDAVSLNAGARAHTHTRSVLLFQAVYNFAHQLLFLRTVTKLK